MKGLVSSVVIGVLLASVSVPALAHDRGCEKEHKVKQHCAKFRAVAMPTSAPVVVNETVEPAVVEASCAAATALPTAIAAPIVATPVVEACPNDTDVLVRAAVFGKHRVARRARKALRAISAGEICPGTTCGGIL